jgi:NTP pyrophosphatase (non-canonical NTP hydrolase)
VLVDVLHSVRNERYCQDRLWGPSEIRPTPTLAVLVEEVGEVAEAIQDYLRARADENIPISGEHEYIHFLRDELVQVAAVAVAMVEGIDRGDVPC